eukprot:CAMPEP_0184236546 /NCGR_PEP_ID=MMETSP0976-20121227/25882_1 /TAXON_ID=483370 /ORGANISM="non described non described, Strain CCMP2097" /LENGTH=90 /DNA_ID=CAMNT_0026541647 /DNA_START=402 /DNA_END=671 /DNA_ORIENTATION=+
MVLERRSEGPVEGQSRTVSPGGQVRGDKGDPESLGLSRGPKSKGAQVREDGVREGGVREGDFTGTLTKGAQVAPCHGDFATATLTKGSSR